MASQLHFVFLVSDSRSGSTLLARELTARLADAVITTELNFDRLFNRAWWDFSPQAIARRVAAQPNFRGNATRDECYAWARKIPLGAAGIARLFEKLVESWLSNRPRAAAATCVVIKNGSHARYVDEINAALGGRAKFLFLVRDPRSVVISKLRTRRPYAPWEVMAWGGSLIASLRWRAYARNMTRARFRYGNVLEIRYEDLIWNPDGVIREIAAFCDCALLAEKQPIEAYQIPPAEQRIHQLVTVDEITDTRIEEWTTALSPHDTRIVEAVCATEMRARGYLPAIHRTYAHRAIVCLRAAPKAGFLALRHLTATVRYGLRATQR